MRKRRLHRPWKVPTHMPRVLIGSIAEMRVSISLAALFVNVTASTPPGPTLPVWISQAMRVVRTRVFPEPAPARISADWSGRVTAASCSGLRFSRRLCIRAFANARFYRRRSAAFASGLHPDLVIVFRELRLALQRLDGGFRIFFVFEARKAHAVYTRFARFCRNDLGGVAGLAQRVVGIQRLARFLERRDRDFPLPAPAHHALARFFLGLRRPFLELVQGHARHRLR